MIKALVLVAATLGEHWICAAPVDPATNPAFIFLWEFEVDGDELVHKSSTAGVTLRHHIWWNDDRRIIFEWQPLPGNNSLAVIEKLAVSEPSFKVYREGKITADGNVEGTRSPDGTCEIFR